MVLVTDDLPDPGLWTIAGGLAALDVARACGVAAALDWPNDLVVVHPQGPPRKLGGILAESRDLDPPKFLSGVPRRRSRRSQHVVEHCAQAVEWEGKHNHKG